MVTERNLSINDQGHNHSKELLGIFPSVNTSVDLMTEVVPLNPLPHNSVITTTDLLYKSYFCHKKIANT